MIDKVTLATISTFVNDTTAATTFNNNMAAITTAMDNTLSRDGTSPNTMSAALDMNSNQIINLPPPSTMNSPARLVDVASNPTIVIPGTGTSGHVVPFLDGNNTWSGTDTFNAGVTFSAPITISSLTSPLPIASGGTGGTTQVTAQIALGLRERLTASRTYFVRFDGSDSNTGLVNNAGGAFLTIQHAVLVASTQIDLNGNAVFIQLADGTWTENVVLMPYVGRTNQGHSSSITIQGNSSTPTSVLLSPASGFAVSATETVFEYTLKNLKIQTPGFTSVDVDVGGWVCFDGVTFGSASNNVICSGGIAEFVSPCTFTGTVSSCAIQTSNRALILDTGNAHIVSGTPSYAFAFIFLTQNSLASMGSVSFTGAATGTRWSFDASSFAVTSGSFDSVFPGNANGSYTPIEIRRGGTGAITPLTSMVSLTSKNVFAALPAASSSNEGAIAAVTDSTTVTWGATVTGGGTNHILAYSDGTNWTVLGK